MLDSPERLSQPIEAIIKAVTGTAASYSPHTSQPPTPSSNPLNPAQNLNKQPVVQQPNNASTTVGDPFGQTLFSDENLKFFEALQNGSISFEDAFSSQLGDMGTANTLGAGPEAGGGVGMGMSTGGVGGGVDGRDMFDWLIA